MSGDEIIRWMDYAWHGVILLVIAALFYGYWYWRWSALVDHGIQPERRRMRRILRPVHRHRATTPRKHRRR
jgi:hypothetical protein